MHYISRIVVRGADSNEQVFGLESMAAKYPSIEGMLVYQAICAKYLGL